MSCLGGVPALSLIVPTIAEQSRPRGNCVRLPNAAHGSRDEHLEAAPVRRTALSPPSPGWPAIRVLMTGPRTDALGGIAACAGLLARHTAEDPRVASVEYVGLAPRLRSDQIGKARSAIRGYIDFLIALTKQPHVAHIHTSRRGDFWRNLPLIWTAHFCRIPVVLHIHPADAFAGFLGHGRRPIRRLKLATVDLAQVLLVPSELGRSAMRSAGVSSRVVTIPNPIELSDYHPAPLCERSPHLVYLGWLIREKGIEDLLAVLPELSRRLPLLRVWMYGPYGASAVREAAAKLGIEHVVHVGDWVKGPEKFELLGRARVLALPSYSEGLPVVLLEAMASGTPCVATRVGGIPEVVEDSRTGYLIDPADRVALVDRIERLFADDAAWEKLSKAAVTSAQRYDATAVSVQVVDEYERLTAGSSA